MSLDLEDIRAQIEEEMTWRVNEMRFLGNQLAYIRNEDAQKLYRKSLIVMLYSHFEGFCKTSFLIYVKAVNKLGINRLDANNHIAAASLGEVFKYYGNTDRKNEYFKNSLPDDEKLHLFSRQVDLVAQLKELFDETVTIPESIVDTESNLKPVVLRKILFRLGFPYNVFGPHEGKIDFLLNRRNSVAHGTKDGGVTDSEYNGVQMTTYQIMTELTTLIMLTLEQQLYLKSL